MSKVYNDAFANTYESLQCMTWTVLFYDFDFNSEKLKQFQKQLTVRDKIIDDSNQYIKVYEKLRDFYGLDCRELTRSFPYISKIKMTGMTKSKGIKSALEGCNNAMEVYLVVLLDELTSDWDMTKDDVLLLFEKLKENSELYRKGMKNDFVKKYFKDAIDLDVYL